MFIKKVRTLKKDSRLRKFKLTKLIFIVSNIKCLIRRITRARTKKEVK